MAPRDDCNSYLRPVSHRSRCENIGRLLWNEDEKTVLGRTAKGWGLIILFYCIFYAVLAVLFAVCMWVMLGSLPRHRPKYTLHQSLIGTNPGMGFRPQFVEEGSLIKYDVRNKTQVAKYVDQLNEWLQAYTNTSTLEAAHRVACNYTHGSPVESQACQVTAASFGPCAADKQFGYPDGRPCIFLKLNKIYDWVPEYYTAPEPTMPTELKNHIEALSSVERDQVWISCEGEDPGDREGLHHDPKVAIDISYYPSPGIPHYYYPYKKQLGYVSPVVAVQFNNIEVGRIINIRCRAWAKNIVYSASLRDITGSTHVEIMVDEDPTAK